jgi:predicted nucleic acid-binding protein
MKLILFDTSVLISGFIASHSQHETSLRWLQRVVQKECKMAVSAHTIAECYSVLTRLPLSPKISPSIARTLIEENIEKLAKIVALTTTDYLSITKEISALGLTGGIVYDAIIFKAAQKIKADHLLTLNPKDFQRFSISNPEFIIS